MGEIVNLNKARKNHNRSIARKRAAENRVRFGRTGSDKAKDRDEAARREIALEGKKLNRGRELVKTP